MAYEYCGQEITSKEKIYPYNEIPFLTLLYLLRTYTDKEFTIHSTITFLKDKEEIIDKHIYNFTFDINGNLKTDLDNGVNEVIIDSLTRFNNKYNFKLDINQFDSEIKTFKKQLLFL